MFGAEIWLYPQLEMVWEMWYVLLWCKCSIAHLYYIYHSSIL